jgi:hypothetical protein
MKKQSCLPPIIIEPALAECQTGFHHFILSGRLRRTCKDSSGWHIELTAEYQCQVGNWRFGLIAAIKCAQVSHSADSSSASDRMLVK